MRQRSEKEEKASQPIRLLVFSTVFPNTAQPHHGIFVRERMRGLPGEVPEEIELRVVAPVPWFPFVSGLRPGYRPFVPREEVQDGVRVLHPRFLSMPRFLKCLDGLFLFLGAWPTLRRLRKEFAFEAIDAHFIYPEGLAAVLLGKAFRVPVLITLRGLLPLLIPYRLRRPQLRLALKSAARVIAVSGSLKQDALSLGLKNDQVRVIENGIDPELFRAIDRSAARAGLGLSMDGPLLVSVGTLSPRKGFHLVIEALPALAARFPGIRFAIVGGAGAEGAQEAELRRLADGLGVADRVIFAGPQKREKLAEWYSAADLSVLASGHEGCPNVVLESLSCGTPVVATPVGDIPRLLADPEVGRIVERDVPSLTEGIAASLSRSWDRERVRARIADRTWRAVGREVMEEIERALLRREPRRSADPHPLDPPLPHALPPHGRGGRETDTEELSLVSGGGSPLPGGGSACGRGAGGEGPNAMRIPEEAVL